MNPLLESFLQEARENLSFIDQNIESIADGDMELVNSVFRAAHTLKGGSGIVGFTSVKDITHHAEDLLDMVRDGDLEPNEAVIEALYNAFDEVMNLVEAAEDTEDIVDADEEVVAEIVETLCACMGKSTEKEAWTIPVQMVSDTSSIINLKLPFLKALDIPFKEEEITEDNFHDERLYAIVFDVDASCIAYGNDPVYTLSLLGDKVKFIYSCMSEDSAKSVLSGLDDEDGLDLHMQIIAFIQAGYADIEEALYNFIEDLVFLPLDQLSLLGISRGEVHTLDVMKDLSANVKKSPENASTIVEESMALIGEETLQYAQLERFLALNCENVSSLNGFFDGLYEGKVFNADAVSESETVEETSPQAPVEVDENALAGVKMIIEQQVLQLEASDNEAVYLRVKEMIERTASMLGVSLEGVSNKQELLSFIANLLGGGKPSESSETVEEEVEVKEATTEAVEATAPAVSKGEVTPEEVIEKAAEPVAESTQDLETPAVVETKVEKKRSVVGKTVKIEQESVDALMNIIGELLVAKNSLPYLADSVDNMTVEETKRGIMEKYNFINRLSEQLQDLIMSMRMLPISYVFDRYPKLVRDIAKKLDKKVKLTMEGGETKLDKNIIEMMADPMIHIMRNSLDHGIESPQGREAKGKTSEGNVTLKAYAQSDKIIIEIKDDGAGINVERVVQKVIEKGLLTMEQIDAMDENAKAELVLLAGLSTAEEITEFSGRGVGMDVVKKSIEGFGGSISIVTKKDVGTTITLAIPVSLAVTSLLHVEMSNVHYGFPMDSVQETVKLEREKIEMLHNEPFIYLRGEVIPLLFINSMLDLDEIKDQEMSIVVLNIKGNLLAVVVNKFLGQLDVVQKPLGGMLEGHPIFSGTALLGNGQIIMMMDPVGLLGVCAELQTPLANVS